MAAYDPSAKGPAPTSDGEGDRVAKALARAGVASRREVERLIAEGRVSLNGHILTTPAVRVGPDDELMLDGDIVNKAEPTRLFRYHKPAGLLTSHTDPKGRPTVFAALPEGLPRVVSIGRLDLASEGLLLLTNDGSLARALELPTTGVTRRYRARAFGHTTQEKLDRLKDGAGAENALRGGLAASGAAELLGELYGRLLAQNRAPDAENLASTWIAKHAGDVRALGVSSVAELLTELAPQTRSDQGRGGGTHGHRR